ncbi:MAG: hypothetical protein US75_C0003G0012 [Candidatus Woesebacteria bacterium GW2011_GWC1_38_13]|uniref:Uncharacterized protein n=3 Tax=Candidatus Woeseibacteriota TaxID=1752722 RepID=A0A0G0L7H5_9BACT|nr:MAG: hypothetical protein US75_C0003G0012 [Candidatus Woesebacteria bacterium GW2011_GWC1_38_13]KKQ83795.1 MAG: hypothetical protein UT06_C0016G0016 [Candidatus Woesebacteria bacterium GW2011_GWA1_38_8]
MTSENIKENPIGRKWIQMRFESFLNQDQRESTLSELQEAAANQVNVEIEKTKKRHTSPDSEKQHKPTKKELKTNKPYFPQIWDIDGKTGIHATMQKRPSNRIEISNPREIYPQQEKKDWQRLHPRKNGWGPYHNLTREEWTDKFVGFCINNLLQMAEWLDLNPDHPKAEYYRKTLFK